MKNLLLLFLLSPIYTIAQISGTVEDKKTKQPVYGAKIISTKGDKAISDFDGKFELKESSIPLTLIISAQGYYTDTVEVKKEKDLRIELKSEIQEVKTVVVTSGRRDQDIEEVPISMEIIRPELIDNKGLANLEEAVDQSPGVYTMDGTVSIRGGSGFAYGAGSRVLLLWNGMPILSGDAADAKWNSIPMECASQVEILKGASSVLYGSGALNGIISLSEREPGLKGEFRGKIQAGVYANPKRASLAWWLTDEQRANYKAGGLTSNNPMHYMGDAYYGKMYKNVGYTISINGFTTSGYKEGEWEDRGRVSGTFYMRPQKFKNLKAGIGYNFQMQQNGNFIIWESDSLAYTPQGGADPYDTTSSSTLTFQKAYRFSIDPYVKFFDKNKNLHTVKSRYYYIQNNNLTNASQSTASGVLYGDYQFQHKWDKGVVLTSGVTGIRTDVYSSLFGDHASNNFAAYSQYEHKISKLNLTAGLRLEYFEQDDLEPDSRYPLGDTSSNFPIYPILRLGAHYQLFKGTHLRASFGQGIRYPSVAERYTSTSVGALNVFPNPGLFPESGWATELGVKQVLMIKKKWKALIDIAGFVNQYDNMMEFSFGLFHPDSAYRVNNQEELLEVYQQYQQTNPGITLSELITRMVGFSAENAEKARITGVELSINTMGEIGDFKITSLLGYTFMNPITLNDNEEYLRTFSTYKDSILPSGDTIGIYDNTLKYRFNHLAKADVEVEWKKISVGFSSRYNSNMTNIDVDFLREVAPDTYILPGLKEYLEENDKGALVFDARIAYKFKEHYRASLIANNIFNREYTSRPGDVQPPRSFILQLQVKF